MLVQRSILNYTILGNHINLWKEKILQGFFWGREVVSIAA
jgi:hypothetical protein